MANLQDVMDQVALIIGGTQYAPAGNSGPKVFSGYLNGDSTGISGIHAAYSSPPGNIDEPPVAIVLPGAFTATLNMQGLEDNVDNLLVRVMVAANDAETQYPNLTPYRDSFPTAFRAKMQLNGTQYVSSAFIDSGKPGIVEWGGVKYLGWDFNLRVFRQITAVTYTP